MSRDAGAALPVVRCRLLFVLLFPVLLAGCAPVITHGPRMEPGLSGGVLVGGDLADLVDSEDTNPTVFPVLSSVWVRHGWYLRDPDGPAFSLGMNIPVPFFTLVEGDAYVQLSKPPGGLDRGLGLLGSGDHVMPYAQIGRTSADGTGWSTTQGIAFFPEIPLNDDFSRGRTVLWMPGFAGLTGGRFVTTQFHLAAGLGLERTQRCDANACRPGYARVGMLFAGFGFEIHKARPRTRASATPPTSPQ